MVRVAWVTGASSGVGRATALRLARGGMATAISARSAEKLEDLAAAVEAEGGRALVVPADVADPESVGRAHTHILDAVGPVSDLVLAAGLNAPKRYWRDQDMETFDAIVATNLTGLVRVIDACLPGMRESGGGTVTVISSYSGWRHSPDAGVAYSASKTALKSICEMLNAQEGPHGVRACHLCPGDIDTGFLAMRPEVPDAQARSRMLTPDDVARAIEFVHTSPGHVRIDELVIAPTRQG